MRQAQPSRSAQNVALAFFEVDHPATQDDKRAKAPEGGGPVYVPADVTDSQFVEKLQEAGFQSDQPTAFVLEGLVAYLDKRAGEPWRFRLPSEQAPSFLADTGWAIRSLLTGSDLDKEHLSQTKLAGRLSALNSSSFVAVAEK